MSDSGRGPELAFPQGESQAAPPDSAPSRPPRTRLFLVRHGRSTWNEIDRIQGQADPPLSEAGRDQAAKLAARLGGRPWVGFYTSDLRRAADTAAALIPYLEREPEHMKELREIHLGDWEGLTRREVEEKYPREWQAWEDEPNYDAVPGGEGAAAFEGRVRGVIDELFSRHPSGDVLVVTHGGVIQVALGHVIGRSSHGFFPFLTHNTSVSVLQKSSSRVVVAGVNDTCHLH